MMEIDTELLISLVEAKPVLWDKSLKLYKNRNGTRKAWEEVCVGLKSDFNELQNNDKNLFGEYSCHNVNQYYIVIIII